MERVVKRILERIEKSKEESILLDMPSAELKINKDNFLDIPIIPSSKTLAYVDGGNLEIFRSPSVSVFFNRVYYTIYQDNKRIENNIFEFFSVICAKRTGQKIVYETECIFTKNKINLGDFEFDSFDKSLSIGNKRVTVSAVGDALRRFAELIVAGEIDADIIVLDGSLEENYTHEDKLLEKLLKERPLVCGLSKTNTFLTNSGNSALAYISGLTDEKTWCYRIGHTGNIDMYFIKLHEKSDYVFRLDTRKNAEIYEILSILSQNSKDAVFPGYPYGLVEADRFARVSRKEREAVILKLKMKFKKDYEKIRPYVNSLNAHDVLDSLS